MKIFISQPMQGKSGKEIAAEREWIKAYLERRLPELAGTGEIVYDGSIEIIDILPRSTMDKPLVHLALSLLQLSDADLAVFAHGWKNVRGCGIEHECCSRYGILTLEVDK